MRGGGGVSQDDVCQLSVLEELICGRLAVTGQLCVLAAVETCALGLKVTQIFRNKCLFQLCRPVSDAIELKLQVNVVE